jgi:Cdc6-like AAA superfamily ATPase
LIYTDFNLYIHGERGVGKTFLLKTIQNEIRQKDPTVFPFFVRLYSLMRMPEISNDSQFSTLVALELTSAIWQQIYLQPVTALANRSNIPDSNTKYAEEKYQYVMDLYQQLSATISRRNFDSTNSIGISSIIKGSVDEKTTFNTEYGKLISIEILNVIKELITFLRQTENKRKLVAICDEASAKG